MISNLVQLEMGLRIALHLQKPAANHLPDDALQLVKAGDILPDNYITNWSTLGMLLRDYNRLAQERGQKLLDDEIADLRDGLAHGRLIGSRVRSEYRLIRFSRPTNGTVTTELAQTVTLAWLEQQVIRTRDAARAVYERIAELKSGARLRDRE